MTDAAARRFPGPWVMGMMSGTALDGVDAALIRTDGRRALARGPGLFLPYDPAFRAWMRRNLGPAAAAAPDPALERALTLRHAAAALLLLRRARLAPAAVRAIGFHGQTIHHDPRRGVTCQLGDGSLLARRTGIPVVYDFRRADVAGGGQGAPLTPLFHAALFAGLPGPLAVLNIGGVANVTWIGPDGTLRAFDTGPGNALLDDFMLARTGSPMDRDGACAAAGRADTAVVDRWLRHPYFRQPPPKSLDRIDFPVSETAGMATADGAASLTAFTARAIGAALAHLPAPPRRWLVCGGGRRNPALMRQLAAVLQAPVQPVEAAGQDGDLLEARAFAFLAARRLAGLPASLPETTGTARAVPGGRVAWP